MMNQEKILNQFKIIIEIFKNNGCELEATLSFIDNNFQYLIDNYEKICDNIYFIYNNQSLYCVLIVKNNLYEWSVYKNNKFGKIRSINSDDYNIKKCDYIVEMMIRFADTDKIKRIVPDIENMDIENKVKTLKKIGLNPNGLHFK